MSLIRDYSKYSGVPGGLWRHQTDRLGDRINAKDYMVGDGTNTVAELNKFVDKVNSGYGTTPFYPATTRLGYLPGGIYRGDGTEASIIHLTGQGATYKGDGQISQLINATIEVDSTNCNVESLRIVGEGDGFLQGIGLDIQSGAGRFFDVSIFNKDIGIANNRAFVPGGFASNFTLFGGQIRDCNTGVSCAAADYRAFGQRISGRNVAFDFYDFGGIELVGCHLSSTGGPSLLVRGHRVDFNANSTAGSAVLSDITVETGDFDTIAVGDVVGYLASLGVMQPNSRVLSISPDKTSITLDRTVLQDITQGVFSVNEAPTESFFVGNTVGSGGGNRYELDVTSITSVDGDTKILVEFTNEHQLTVGMGRVTFENTGVPFYDDQLNRGWIIHVPTSKSVVVSYPYQGPVTPPSGLARLLTPADSAQYITSGPGPGQISSMFTTGGNQNNSRFKGGVGYNFIGTRLKARKYMHGCRPFQADVTLGSYILTNLTIPTSEIRLGTHIQLGTILPAFTRVVEIPGAGSALAPNSVRIDKLPLLAGTQVLIRSPEQPNNIFHVATVDNQGPGGGATVGDDNLWRRFETVPFQGPGSLVGWSDVGMYTVGAGQSDTSASEDSFFVGARCAYTQGGLLDNQPAHLNEFGMMNSGFYMKSNMVKHNIKGNDWYIDDVLAARIDATGVEIVSDLILPGIPTTLPGTPGRVWNDAGTLKIS
jgi:hypothetical protein